MNDITYVGLDVHKATVCVATAESGRGGEVREVGVFENRPDVLRKMVARLGRQRRRLNFCYEAGPCGYGLHRLLIGLGHDCVVVAPSLIPMKAGDRVKTDRRDALMLVKLHRAGELTPIWIPDAAHEAMRDLVRARATAVRAVSKARQHLQGFLLRAVLEYANLSYLPTAAALGSRHANGRLVHIQSNVCDIVHQARPPCLRLCAGNPAQPSTLCMPRTGRRSLSERRV